MSVARYVNMSFVAIGLLLYVIAGEFFAATIGWFGSSANVALLGPKFRVAHLLALLVAVGVGIWLRRNEKVHTYAMEVGSELSRVSWPTWKETKKATFVVLVTTLIIASILGLLDLLWSALSKWFYS